MNWPGAEHVAWALAQDLSKCGLRCRLKFASTGSAYLKAGGKQYRVSDHPPSPARRVPGQLYITPKNWWRWVK